MDKNFQEGPFLLTITVTILISVGLNNIKNIQTYSTSKNPIPVINKKFWEEVIRLLSLRKSFV
jgi:hypothetical protein